MPRAAAAVAAALAGLLLVLLGPRPVAAGPAPDPRLDLFVFPGSISFPDANPDMVAFVTSSPATVTVALRVRNNRGGSWQLTVAANDHLRSGTDTIAINNVTWVTTPATGPWTSGGTLALVPGQLVASGTDNQNWTTANLQFRLANLWTYAVGTYSTIATFTLSAP